MPHLSDSTAQREAEVLIREKLAETLGLELAPKAVALGSQMVEVDGVSSDYSVFVEVLARQGALKGGQKHKVKGDALKLITLSRKWPDARLILAFGSEEAARFVQEKSWVAEALRAWGIEVFIAELTPSIQSSLRTVQARQVMVNLPPLGG